MFYNESLLVYQQGEEDNFCQPLFQCEVTEMFLFAKKKKT